MSAVFVPIILDYASYCVPNTNYMVKMKVVIMEGENISSIKRLNENYKKTLFLFKSGFYFIKKSKFNTASIVIRMFATA